MSQNTKQILNPVLSGYTAVYYVDEPDIPRAIFQNPLDAIKWVEECPQVTRRERVDIGALLRYDGKHIKP